MSAELKFLIVFMGLVYGAICIYRPMWVAFVIARFTKSGLGNALSHSNPKLQEIIFLIERGGNEYTQAYPNHIARIKTTGVVALFVSIIGICMLIYNLQ